MVKMCPGLGKIALYDVKNPLIVVQAVSAASCLTMILYHSYFCYSFVSSFPYSYHKLGLGAAITVIWCFDTSIWVFSKPQTLYFGCFGAP